MLDTLVRHLAMVRLSIASCAVIALVGCTGLIDAGGDSNLTPQQRVAQEKWIDLALPVFKTNCVGCHAGATPNVAFLTGTSDLDIRTTLMAYTPQVVNLDAPQSSRVLTKGAHNGPALLADQASNILEWINAEKDALAGTGSGATLISTPMFTPQPCTAGVPGDPTCPINHVPLDMAGIPGAEIQLVIQALDNNDIYVTDLYMVGGPSGAYVEHPLFVSYPADPMAQPIPDSIDRFFDVKLDVPTGAVSSCHTTPVPPNCGAIGGGTAAFIGFPPNNQLAIHFKVASAYQPPMGGGGGTTGCKVMTSFTTNVQPKMATGAQPCSSCHMGQNANATSAMDITGITTVADATAQQNACNQVRTRVNFQDIPNSGVLLAPLSGGDGAHPFKLSAASNPTITAFQTSITTWINDEKAAP